MPPRIAHPAGALVTKALFGRCGTHSHKTFAQTVLADNFRTTPSLLGERKRGRYVKNKKPKPNLIIAKPYQQVLLTFLPFEAAEERAMGGELSVRTV